MKPYSEIYAFIKENYKPSRFEERNNKDWGEDYSHRIVANYVTELQKNYVAHISKHESITNEHLTFDINLNFITPKKINKKIANLLLKSVKDYYVKNHGALRHFSYTGKELNLVFADGERVEFGTAVDIDMAQALVKVLNGQEQKIKLRLDDISHLRTGKYTHFIGNCVTENHTNGDYSLVCMLHGHLYKNPESELICNAIADLLNQANK